MPWKLICKHNLIPHSARIWNNRYATIRSGNEGVWSILHLVDDVGAFLEHYSFIQKYLRCSNRQFTSVIRAVSTAVLHLGSSTHSRITAILPPLTTDSSKFIYRKCTKSLEVHWLKNYIQHCYWGKVLEIAPSKISKESEPEIMCFSYRPKLKKYILF